MNGSGRLHIGVAHEKRVQTELERRGWHCQQWGQGLMTDRVRRTLVDREPDVLWRWLPDLIAVKGNAAVLVDPKTDLTTSTPNFSIEISAIIAHSIMRQLGLKIVYVWSDLTCNTVENLRPVRWHMPDPGRTRVSTKGSGTAYALIRKADQVPMDEWFGTPLEASA